MQTSVVAHLAALTSKATSSKCRRPAACLSAYLNAMGPAQSRDPIGRDRLKKLEERRAKRRGGDPAAMPHAHPRSKPALLGDGEAPAPDRPEDAKGSEVSEKDLFADSDDEGVEDNEMTDGEGESNEPNDAASDLTMYLGVLQEGPVRGLLNVATELGGRRRKNERLVTRDYRAIVSEIYSPPRVAEAARVLSHLEIAPGLSLDITQCDELGEPWDFNKRHMREKARMKLLEQEPELLVGSPMCTAFSSWQRINRQRDPWRYKRELRKARRQ